MFEFVLGFLAAMIWYEYLVLIIGSLLLFSSAKEESFWFFLLGTSFMAFLWWRQSPAEFPWILSAAYFPIGAGWGFWRWQMAKSATMSYVRDFLKRFPDRNKLPSESKYEKIEYFTEQYKRELRNKASLDHVLFWFFAWPLSLFDWIFSDMLRQMYKFVGRKYNEIFERATAKAVDVAIVEGLIVIPEEHVEEVPYFKKMAYESQQSCCNSHKTPKVAPGNNSWTGGGQ